MFRQTSQRQNGCPNPMRGYNGYEYEHEYPEYAQQGGPRRIHGLPAYQQPQPASNPFIQGAVQPPTVASKRNSGKKRQGVLMSIVPVPTTQVPTTSVPADPS